MHVHVSYCWMDWKLDFGCVSQEALEDDCLAQSFGLSAMMMDDDDVLHCDFLFVVVLPRQASGRVVHNWDG